MKKIIISLIVLVALVVGYMFIGGKNTGYTTNPKDMTALEAPGGEYKNDVYKFSVSLPKGYSSREIKSETGDTVLFENSKGEGVQIVISQFDDVAKLTEEMIKKDVPDMVIKESQPVEIGVNHTGLAFKSDNEAFNGASREVWFVFGGNLYQISTYDRLDSLLKSIFATWKFLQ